MINKKRLLERFFKYITCASESQNEREFCELIEHELADLGIEVMCDYQAAEKAGSNGWNIFANLPGEGEPILFSAHLDTVSPGAGIQPVIEDGIIHSLGDTILGADDKSGIAAVMEAINYIRENNLPHRPIEVLFSVCEETGLYGSRYADYSIIRSKRALVLDSGALGRIINFAAKNIVLHFEITGKSAHAVSHQKGIHALKAAAQALNNMPVGDLDDVTIANVSNFLSPGKTNVIAAHASFDMEIRSYDSKHLERHFAAADQIVREACEAYGAAYTISSEVHSEVLSVPADSVIISELSQCMRKLGITPDLQRTYGGSDASNLFSHGIDTVNIGTGMCSAHSTSEHIAVADLEKTASLVLEMMSLQQSIA